MENINGDDLDDTGDLDLTAIYTDEDYTGDTVFQNQDEINDILKEREARISELLDHMDEVGGVNRAIAMEMENLEPGIVTRYRSLQSYTEDYSRTNYRETRISLEVLHVAAVAAIAVGVGVLLAAFIGWLLKTFFDEESSGGGGAERAKKLGDNIKNLAEAQAEAEETIKQFIALSKKVESKIKQDMFDALPDDKKKELEKAGKDYDKHLKNIYKNKCRESYTVYVDEMVSGKGSEHIKFITELIQVLPEWLKQLKDKQTKLMELTKSDNKDEINPDKFFIEVKFGGKEGDQLKSLMDQKIEYYRTICKKGDDQWYNSVEIKTGKAIGGANFLDSVFAKIDKSHATSWTNIENAMKGYTEAIKKAEIPKERQAALTQSWKNLKFGFDSAISGYRIFQQCLANTEKLVRNMDAAHEERLKLIEKMCKIVISKAENEDDKKEAQSIATAIAGFFGGVMSRISVKLGGGKKKEGDAETPPAGGSTPPTPPAAT